MTSWQPTPPALAKLAHWRHKSANSPVRVTQRVGTGGATGQLLAVVEPVMDLSPFLIVRFPDGVEPIPLDAVDAPQVEADADVLVIAVEPAAVTQVIQALDLEVIAARPKKRPAAGAASTQGSLF